MHITLQITGMNIEGVGQATTSALFQILSFFVLQQGRYGAKFVASVILSSFIAVE